ncbi:hypothetical protein DFH06DRAFT_1042894, partial [Mycena polygramma]
METSPSKIDEPAGNTKATETEEKMLQVDIGDSDAVKHWLHNAFAVTSTETESVQRLEAEATIVFTNALHFPHSFAEYKKFDEGVGKALNQGRMYLASALAFYAVLGIVGYPLYTTVTSGPVSVVIFGWKSATEDRTFIL